MMAVQQFNNFYILHAQQAMMMVVARMQSRTAAGQFFFVQRLNDKDSLVVFPFLVMMVAQWFYFYFLHVQ
jgi:hypothetical protein